MDKPLLTNTDFWTLIKWIAGVFGTAGLFIVRFVCSHFYEKLESHDEQLKKIEIILAKISTKLEIKND